jgi:hypothetical protein
VLGAGSFVRVVDRIVTVNAVRKGRRRLVGQVGQWDRNRLNRCFPVYMTTRKSWLVSLKGRFVQRVKWRQEVSVVRAVGAHAP